MSDVASTTPTAKPHRRHFFSAIWRARIVIAVIMILLSVVGLGLAASHSSYTQKYWLWLLPAFGLLSIGLAWLDGKELHQRPVQAMFRQVLHWGGATGATLLLVNFEQFGIFSAESAGPALLMLLALTTFLAGVHLDWTLVFIGVALAVVAIMDALAEEYLVFTMLPVFIVGAIVLVGWQFLSHRRRAS